MSQNSGFQLPLGNKHYGRSDSDQGTNYSAKVSDFEAADSETFSGGEISDDNSDNFSARISSSNTEVELTESDSEADSYSGMESEYSSTGDMIQPMADVFITEGRQDNSESQKLSVASEPRLVQAAKSGDISLIKKLIAEGVISMPEMQTIEQPYTWHVVWVAWKL